MSQKAKTLFGVLTLAVAFVGLAYLAQWLNAPVERKPGETIKHVTTLNVHGPIGNATMEQCAAEAARIASVTGRKVSFTFMNPKADISFIITPGQSAEHICATYNELLANTP